jgi:hypothetical protein
MTSSAHDYRNLGLSLTILHASAQRSDPRGTFEAAAMPRVGAQNIPLLRNAYVRRTLLPAAVLHEEIVPQTRMPLDDQVMSSHAVVRHESYPGRLAASSMCSKHHWQVCAYQTYGTVLP